jgi:hypothetical protein
MRGNEMTENARLLQLLEDSYREGQELLKIAKPLQVIYTDGSWRAKDIFAHIIAWDENVATGFEALLEGDEFRLRNFQLDAYNDRMFRERYNLSMAQIEAMWAKVQARLKTAVNAFTQAHFDGDMLYPSGRRRGKVAELLEEVVEHRREHLMDIESAT